MGTTSTTKYGIARNLRGFRSSSLRVRIEREEAGCVWVRTADLMDAGTALVLDAAQVETEPQADAPWQHRGGLVAFG